MKILKLFGIVVAAHVAVFLFIFAIPGCRSTAKPGNVSGGDMPAPTPVAATGDTVTPVQFTPAVTPVAPADGAPSSVLYSPTRPGTPVAAAIEAQPVAPIVAQPVSAYTVAKGDSLWSIAKKHGITVKELAAANNMSKSSSPLKLGQHLVIPGKSSASTTVTGATAADAEAHSYTVKSGDTLSEVARHAGTTKAELRKLNKLKLDTLHVGQVLQLPTAAASHVATTTTHTHPTHSTASAEQGVSVDASVYVIKAGDTLGSIAHKYHVKSGDIAAANNIADPTKIRIGQKLKIPGHQSSAPAAAVTAAPAESAAPVAPASDSPVSAGSPLFTPVAPASSPSPVDGASPLLTPAPASSPVDTTSGAPVIPVQDATAPIN